MQPIRTVICSIFYSVILWFSAYAAPYAKGTNSVPQKFDASSYSIPMESQADVNLDKRVHSLSLLRTRYAPQNYFSSNAYSTPEVSQQRRLNKRVHHLSLLRMGKLFKPNTAPQVKRLSAESLWRYLASDSLKLS